MHLPPYPAFPELVTVGKYRLRQVLARDLRDILDILFYDGVPSRNVEEATTILNRIDRDYEQGTAINWGIESPEDGRIIGTLGFYRGFENNAGEIGFILKELFRGKGIMAQAITTVTMFGLHEMGLNTVRAYTREDNFSARALLDRISFIQEPSIVPGYLCYVLSARKPANN